MAFLHRALGMAPFRRIWRESVEVLQEHLWNDILMRQRFSTLGAAQFASDVFAITSVINEYIPHGPKSVYSMPKMKEALRLLSLPVVDVRQAYERVMVSNAEAKKVVEELEFTTLTHHEARQVLERRVEASN
jgi:hypothetical protein